MTDPSIRPAFSDWPDHNRRLVEVVEALTDEQLAGRPTADRWPIWATIGHLACQRVFWMCDFAGEPGAETTRFVNAAYWSRTPKPIRFTRADIEYTNRSTLS